jgi:hypothetical protein
MKSKVNSMLIVIFNIKEIVHKKFILQAKEIIPHTTVTCLLQELKSAKPSSGTFVPEELTVASRKHHLTVLFTTGCFDHKQNSCHPPSIMPFAVSSIKYKTEEPPF